MMEVGSKKLYERASDREILVTDKGKVRPEMTYIICTNDIKYILCSCITIEDIQTYLCRDQCIYSSLCLLITFAKLKKKNNKCYKIKYSKMH